MACCAGKGKSGGDEIPFVMKEVKIDKFDELFKEGSEALQRCEEFRSGMQDAKAACMEISGAYTLKVGSIADALKVWMWSVGNDIGADKLANFKPSIDMEKGIDIELDSSVSDKNKEFLEAFKIYMAFVIAFPQGAVDLQEALKSITEKATELAGTAKDDCAAAGLGAMDTAKAIVVLGANTKTLATGTVKLTALVPVGQEAFTDCKDLTEKFGAMLAEADKNCEEGKAKGAKIAAEYMAKQHPGEKLDAKQAAADKNHIAYTKFKESGKKLPTKPRAGAPAAEAAAEAAGEVAAEASAAMGAAMGADADGEAAAAMGADADGDAEHVAEALAALADVNPEIKDV